GVHEYPAIERRAGLARAARAGDHERLGAAIEHRPAYRALAGIERRARARDQGVTLHAVHGERIAVRERCAPQFLQQELARRLLLGTLLERHLHHRLLLLRYQQPVALVLHLPALGECHRELHARVIEAVVAHDALLAGGAEGHALDRLEVLLAVVEPAAARHGGDVRRPERRRHYALIGGRVVGEDAVIDVGVAAFVLGARELEGLLRLEHLHRIAHRLGVIAAARGVLDPEAIGLGLVVAAVTLV